MTEAQSAAAAHPHTGRFRRVRPAQGGCVPVPGQSRLLAAGESVDVWDAYWAQMLREGSVVVDEVSPADPAQPAAD